MGKLSPYARKEWQRKHSTSKEMRWLNKGIDAAIKGATATGRSASEIHSQNHAPDAWKRTALTPKQLRAAVIVGAILPMLALGGLREQGFGGMFLLVEFFFFLIPFLVMMLIFMVFNSLSRPSAPQEQEAPQEDESMILLVPQLEKQVNECEELIRETTSPQVFFERYDFCVKQLKTLQSLGSHTINDVEIKLRQMESLSHQDIEVLDLIQRVKEKYRVKIDRLKTAKAKQNWAIKFHQEFEPYVPRMSDIAKTSLAESSAELCVLAGMDGE